VSFAQWFLSYVEEYEMGVVLWSFGAVDVDRMREIVSGDLEMAMNSN
jgi:hypothetical protein